jgi:signal transduction histidine kinase
MKDKRILFPALLFAIFFVLIAITGFLQIAIIKRNIEVLLRGEGETLFTSIAREIEISMEYLAIVEKSPSIITPNVLNVMTYDEAIVDDIVSHFSHPNNERDTNTSLPDNMLILSREGKVIESKGHIKVGKYQLDALVKTDQQTEIRLPNDDDGSLFMGVKFPDRIVFFTLSSEELEALRRSYVVRTIVENEQKRFEIVEINLYDGSGKLYLGTDEKRKDVLSIKKTLSSGYFPKYTMEILISNKLAIDTLRRTSLNFVFLLFLLMCGGAGGIYVIFRLERRHAESLKEIEKDMALKERLVSLGKLSSGMAHEIRNPLNAIGMSIQRLKREFLPEDGKQEEYQAFLEIVRSEVFRVNRIVEEFLLSTKSGMAMERQSLSGILDGIIAMLSERASRSAIDITNDCDPEIFVDCQKERITQVFYNLIVNGIEAIGQEGKIRLSCKQNGLMVTVFIEDTGYGIKKDDLRKVFEYYYTTKDKGMGLGLPLSYMIVKDHGGDIQVMSEEGKGTTFVITLPMEQRP